MSKCKHCKKPDATMKINLATFCDVECAYSHARAIQTKKASKDLTEQRKRDRETLKCLKTRSEWMRELQAVFNKFIRLRDAELPCISCGRFHQGQWHAGHYLSVGAHPELRFNELNVWRQCQPCNSHLSGNLINYRIELIKRIGLAEVEKLEGKQEPLKLTVEQIQNLIKEYKAKVKAMTHPTS